MLTYLQFIKETEAKRSYDTMVPGSRSYVPVRNDGGIGPTVPNNQITDESESSGATKKKTKKSFSLK